MTATTLTTVLIPAKDEAALITECLASVAAQDHPHELIEVVVVVDADSTDNTDELAKSFLDQCEFARAEVIRSARAGTPNNLNAGLAIALGEVVCRVDAHSRIPSSYVSTCVATLTGRPDVAVVGGAQVAVAPTDDAMVRGIARALNNRYATGWSRYRRGAESGPADTVYLGAFRADTLRAAGGWSAEFLTNQDFELNRRLGSEGLIWFDASIPVEYVPRSSLRSLHQQYVRFGRWKARYWRRTGDRPRPRQVALLVGAPIAGAGAIGLVVASRHRAVALGILAAGGIILEARGTRGPRASVGARCCALTAMAAVATGWLSGAWRELLRPTD
jgi:glycosyltransferase involved in cell wall biosynthesis